MLGFAGQVAIPVHVLLTKADKLRRGQAASTLLGVRKELGVAAGAQLFSALDRQGLDEARSVLQRFLAG
jgi:GTP-binding protein